MNLTICGCSTMLNIAIKRIEMMLYLLINKTFVSAGKFVWYKSNKLQDVLIQ